jgi:hypothetical protein
MFVGQVRGYGSNGPPEKFLTQYLIFFSYINLSAISPSSERTSETGVETHRKVHCGPNPPAPPIYGNCALRSTHIY